MHPTDLFTSLRLQNQSRDVFEVHKFSWSPDLEALKLGKGRSGSSVIVWDRLCITSVFWAKFLWSYPTNPFSILEPQDQEIGEFYVVQERRATDLKAPKLWKGSSGRPMKEEGKQRWEKEIAAARPTFSQLGPSIPVAQFLKTLWNFERTGRAGIVLFRNQLASHFYVLFTFIFSYILHLATQML